jgi:hypothetical protein
LEFFRQFVEQDARGEQIAAGQASLDDVAAQTLGNESRNQNVGINNQPHETILKTWAIGRQREGHDLFGMFVEDHPARKIDLGHDGNNMIQARQRAQPFAR